MSFIDNCGNYKKLSVIAGPCVFEDSSHAVFIAEFMKNACDAYGLNFIYKTSFEKANRTSHESYTGKGFDAAYMGLQAVRQLGVEIITDVHEPWQCQAVADTATDGFANILQIPAFLCRQTSLLQAAAETGLPVNVKKGQFLSPEETVHIVKKLQHFGAKHVMITERGTTFGYNNLVVDMRGLDYMRHNCLGAPIIMDCTHATQKPGGLNGKSGGDREMAKVLARAAVAVGVAGVFMEVHQNPDEAPSDGPNMIHLMHVPRLLEELVQIDEIRKGYMNLNPKVEYRSREFYEIRDKLIASLKY